MRTCGTCGRNITSRNSQALYCSTRCRVAAHRTAYPTELTRRRTWTRADGKRPITTTGAPASSTNPDTWTTYRDVKASTAGDGLGIMLGDGLGCYDLDHITDTEARELAALIPEHIIYAERSISGNGAHIFFATTSDEHGTKSWQGRHERYTHSRFIRTTGRTITL